VTNDPLEIGYEALKDLAVVRSALKGSNRTLPELDRIAEAVRRLAWGPD
jgi:hypothetical protein